MNLDDMTASHDESYVQAVLKEARNRTPNKTEQAEWLAEALSKPACRAAFARWIIARQVPLVGEVT